VNVEVFPPEKRRYASGPVAMASLSRRFLGKDFENMKDVEVLHGLKNDRGALVV
jgi:hypothetical protein